VLKRAGHTEAAVDLARLSGLYPAGVICEIQNDNGSMARLPELIEYAKKHDLKLISIADLISYRLEHERFVHRETVAKLPTQFGDFNIYAYRNSLDNTEHVAIVKGDPSQFPTQEVIVRVHSECLTGDALGSLRCDCRGQLQSALKMIEYAGAGVVVYLRQEGRGIGLINKLKAYSLQDLGLDTVEANERLGFAPDLRTYGVGGQILYDLGVRQMRLITNNPRKIAGLKGFGIEVVGRLPLLIETNAYNLRYLETKAEKLGHLLLQTRLITLFVRWFTIPDTDDRERVQDKLQSLASSVDLLVQEEASLAVAARFGVAYHVGSPLAALASPQCTIVHLGLDVANRNLDDWYARPEHPYRQAIAQVLNALAQLPDVSEFKFFVASPQSVLASSRSSTDIANTGNNGSHEQNFDPQIEWQPGITYQYKQIYPRA
jgi:3,4-dihydroxy 2-butanone 4-phosphate synthase/GTP cyclohydrolase II